MTELERVRLERDWLAWKMADVARSVGRFATPYPVEARGLLRLVGALPEDYLGKAKLEVAKGWRGWK